MFSNLFFGPLEVHKPSYSNPVLRQFENSTRTPTNDVRPPPMVKVVSTLPIGHQKPTVRVELNRVNRSIATRSSRPDRPVLPPASLPPLSA